MSFKVSKPHDFHAVENNQLPTPEVAQLGSQLRVTTELRQPAQRLCSHMRPERRQFCDPRENHTKSRKVSSTVEDGSNFQPT